jgi:hypothetical protein
MRGLKYELTSITPPRKLVHVMNTLEKGRRKREVVEKLILGENIFI